MNIRYIIIFSFIFLFSNCGGGGETPPPQESEKVSLNPYSFKDLELYSFNLDFSNNILKFKLNEIATDRYTYKYFEDSNYTVDTKNQQILLDGKTRATLNDIEYSLSSSGNMIASFNSLKIFELSIYDKNDTFSSNILEEYHQNINLVGTKYSARKEYFVNFYTMEDLVSLDNIDTLTDFINQYRSKTFLGSDYRGLIFSQDNKLLEIKNEEYIDAGTFEIKTIDNKDIVFIYPIDTINYSPDTCFILDLNKVWKSKCYLKDSIKNINLYDDKIYNQVLEYLQTHFTDVAITL